jgi:arginine/lysine/histidine transport system permease protein
VIMAVLTYVLDFGPVLKATGEFMEGVGVTLLFSLGTVFFGTVLGFLINLGHMSKKKWLSWTCGLYVSVLRGTPLLIQLYLLAYGIPIVFSLNVSIYLSGLIALSLNSSAYVAEIFRSGTQAVDIGQTEAGRSLGLSRNYTSWHIVFPQALKNVPPAIGNEFVTIVKESSVVSIIGIADITRVADLVKSSTLKVFEALLYAALLYYIVTTFLSALIKLGEKRLNKYADR